MGAALTYFGNEGPWLQPGGELVTARHGLTTGRLIFKVKVNDWANMPKVNDEHPMAWWCTMERRSVVFRPGFWLVNCEYAGVESEETDPVFEFNPGVGNEAIETHDKFDEKIGGRPSSPKNGAVFVDGQGNVTQDDDVGQFDRFKLMLDGTQNDLAGVREYLMANNSTWTKSWARKTMPTEARKPVRIGRPDGNPPVFEEGYNWLELPPTYTRRGSAYDCRQTWLLSGPKGWNPKIYGDE